LSSCLLSKNVNVKNTQNSDFNSFYGFEIWWEESILRVFENRVLRRISGPKRRNVR
jgi:hypothetical protein